MFANGLATGALAALLAGGQLAAAHMEISYPPPFRSKFNPNAVNIDYTNTAPLADTGANYPCKGYHSDLGTAAGKSVATFAPGGSYNFTVAGAAPHGGGSCQVSLSYDKGKTFTVIQSIIGGCPLSSSYPFKIPEDAPAGEAIWAWSWNNEIGNREFYMNCAAVTIGGGAKRDVPQESVEKRAAFSSRPPIFVANLGNGCKVPEGTDVDYPNPGPDVIRTGNKIAPPQGSCGASGAGSGAGAGAGNGSGSNQGGSAPSTTVQATAAPSPSETKQVSLPGGVFITVPGGASTSQAAAAPSPTTLIVSTKPAAPSPTGTTGSGSGSGNNTGNTGGGNTAAGAHAQGTACSSEGAWNCIGGTSFQRCAEGVWTAVQAVAPGTVCKAGEGDTLSIDHAAGARFRHRRFHAAGKVRL
ncbi:hypothetical protein VTI74DRAFT_1833 [Chaetomium olivicolor]